MTVLFKEALTEYKELAIKELNLDCKKLCFDDTDDDIDDLGFYLTGNKKCMDDLNFRFSCTSPKTLQEFQHPYYASHLDDAYRDIKRNKELLELLNM